MTVTVNGEQKQVEEGCALPSLITALELKPERLAIEVNGSIVRRANWSATVLSEGDKIEIVHFVGGGSDQ